MQIFTELAVSDDNFTVGESRIEGGAADRPRYRAVLVQWSRRKQFSGQS